MAEEKQENMSMDEILSSIKNILSDGTDASNETMVEPSTLELEPEVINIEIPDTSSVDLALDETDDGILDLTADMRVSDTVADSMPDVTIPSIAEEDDINISEELSAVDIDFSSADTPTDISEPVIAPIDEIEENIVSDPIYSPEEDDISQPLYSGDDDILTDTPEVSSATDDFNITAMSAPEPAIILPEDNISVDVSEPTENTADSTDVSASIINNFAKIFAGNSSDEPVAETPKISSSVKLGEDATLSDIIKASIRDMIAENTIMQAINAIDVNTLVAEEVSAQVKSWLNNNLPTLVENVVKKEIERVMVKAGKN